jgi:benzylsuccinate CoA-transferase BbsE subunit
MGRDRGGIRLADIPTDVEMQQIFRAGRDALVFIASRMRAADFFLEGQRRGLAVGVLNAPEDVMEDAHFVARGFPTKVHHDELGRDVLYPGAPFLSDASPSAHSEPGATSGSTTRRCWVRSAQHCPASREEVMTGRMIPV